MKNTFSLKNKQSRIVLYLVLAIFAIISSLVATGAWFLDRDAAESGMPMGEAVVVDLVGTGSDGTIQNFAQLYDSSAGAYPGDKILDTVSVKMGEKTEESVLRVQFGVNVLDQTKAVKTQDLTEVETNLVAMLKEDLKEKTTLFSSDWEQKGEWIYYKHLASGKANIQIFEEYNLPLPDSEMDNQYQALSFRISLVAEAIQAANILTYDEWNTAITSLSDSVLLEAVLKYNGERFSAVSEVLPYVETTGTQHINTQISPTLDTEVEITFSTSSFGKWLFGSRTSDGAADSYAANVSASNQIWFQMQSNSTSSKFSTTDYSNKQTVLKTNKDAVFVNGTQIGTMGRTSLSATELTLYLGALNQGGSVASNAFVGKIYSAKIWQGGKLVRHFVPARDTDNNVGFYDLVGAQMFLNAGSGNFAYGHSIVYMANGGTLDASSPKSFVSGSLPITLKNPTREGYEFDGWFLTSSFSGTAQTTIPAGTDQNVYLYAKWIKTFNITYHLGGGTNNQDNPSSFTEKTLPITLKDPTREGYSFGGWFSNPTFSGDAETQIATGTQTNVSLWAKWSAVEKSVTYVLNGGTNDEKNVSAWTILDAPLRLYNPTQDGKTFEGWFASSDFSGDRVTYLSKEMFGDVTLYAQWADTHSITYHLGGGLNDGRNPKTFTKNTETITLFEPTRVNYTFVGWFDNEALSGTAVTQIEKGTETDVVLWAKWNSTQITVSFDATGGSVSPIKQIVEKDGVYGDLPTPTKAGYTFDGWFDAKQNGTQITASSTVSTNVDHTLFAHWTENVYDITYHLDGGTNNAGNPATFSRTQLPVSLLDASKSGAYFAGWYLDSAFTKRVTKIDGGTLKDVDLWARFSTDALVFDLVGSSAYSVRAANTSISGSVVIPSTHNEKPVVVIQNSAFADCTNVTSVQIPTSVKSIGINAFENCTQLSSITIPEGVTLVPNNAFVGCSALSEVKLPKSVENIGTNAFAGCTQLTSIILPSEVSEIGRNAFGETSQYGEEIAMTSEFWSVGHYSSGHTSNSFETGNTFSTYAKIVGAQSETYVDTAWQLEMKNPISVVGGKTYVVSFYVKAENWVENTCFIVSVANWNSLITWSTGTQGLPNQLNFADDGQWHRLEFSVTAPSGATTMKVRLGADNPNIYGIGSSLEIAHFVISKPQTLQTVEVYADTPPEINGSVFPSSVQSIYVKAASVSAYKTAWSEYASKIVALPTYSITYNLNGSTNSDKNPATFAKYDLPLTLVAPTMANADFAGWYTSSTFSGDPITQITTAQNITLYARWHRKITITYVLNGGTNNASNASVISEADLPYTFGAPSRTSYVFVGWFTDEDLTNQITQISQSTDDEPFQSSITVYASWEYDDPNLKFELNSAGTGYIVSAKNTSITEANIPEEHKKLPVTEIKASGFENCANLKSVSIPSSVTQIGSSAFSDCKKLTQLILPSGLTEIASRICQGCSALKSVNIPRSVTTINTYAFSDCAITSISLPEGLKYIYDGAFASCKFISVTLPSTLEEIGRAAFSYCESLTRIYIPDSVTTISAGYYFWPFNGCSSSLQIYCGATAKPSGWNSEWNYYAYGSPLSVTWGATGLPSA